MNINNHTNENKENRSLEEYYKPINTFRYSDNTQQYDCLHKTYTVTSPTDAPTRTEETLQAPPLDEELPREY